MRLLLVAMVFLLAAMPGCGSGVFESQGVIQVSTSSGLPGKALMAAEVASLGALGSPMLAPGDRLEVSADTDASLLTVSVRGGDALRSQETARKIVEAYVVLPRTAFEVTLMMPPTQPIEKSQ